uniref:Uncharacterized protein n=1 Tax=Cacopsylla melanoneura TaxID=428564 RepID=A0A8D8S2P6_9HEMI
MMLGCGALPLECGDQILPLDCGGQLLPLDCGDQLLPLDYDDHPFPCGVPRPNDGAPLFLRGLQMVFLRQHVHVPQPAFRELQHSRHERGHGLVVQLPLH